MEYLVQAAKLLQLSKISIEEIGNAAEICYLLNTTQIKKFLSIYQPLEYEVSKKRKKEKRNKKNNNILFYNIY